MSTTTASQRDKAGAAAPAEAFEWPPCQKRLTLHEYPAGPTGVPCNPVLDALYRDDSVRTEGP